MWSSKSKLLIASLTFLVGIVSVSILIKTSDDKRALTPNTQETNRPSSEVPSPENETVSESIDKIENWQIPVPTKKKRGEVRLIDLIAENGKSVKVTATNYSAADKFVTEKPFDSKQLNQSFGLCRIVAVTELKINDKIFGYLLNAFAVRIDERTGKIIDKGLVSFVYRYMDTDGDGRFETHLTGDSKFTVPNWALK